MGLVEQLMTKSYATIDLEGSAPFGALKNVITTMTNDPDLVAKVNANTPGGKWPNIKTAALDKISHPSVDLKVPFDMSPERYDKLGDEMVRNKGDQIFKK